MIITVPLSAAAGSDSAEARRDAAKADYIFNSSLYYYATEQDDAFFDLASYAYDINPKDSFLSALAGIKSIVENATDSIGVARGHLLADGYFYSTPDDVYMGIPYAKVLYSTGSPGKTLELMEKIYRNNPTDADVMLNYISVLGASRSDENIDKALEVCDQYESVYGSDLNSFRRKAELYGLKRDSAAVINESRRLLAQSPGSAITLSIVGAIYANYASPDSAAYFFDKAIENDPSLGAPYIFRSNLYLQNGDTARYIASTLDAIRQPDLSEDVKVSMLAEYLTAASQSDSISSQAGGMLDFMADTYPHSLPVRDFAARYYAQKGDFTRAEENARFAVDLDPENENCRVLLTSLYYLDGDYRSAAAAALQAFEDIPQHTDFLLTASNAYMMDEDFEASLRMIDKLEALTDSTDREALSNIWLTRGDVYYRMDSTALSDSAYRKSIQLNPDNALALNNYAYNLACRDTNLDLALEMIVKSLNLRPDEVNSLDTYAWVLFKRRSFDQAKDVIDRLLADDENPSWELLEHAGDIYFMCGKPDEAVAFWERASELNPDNELLHRKAVNKAYYYK